MNRRTLVLMALAVVALTLAASAVAWGNPGDPTDPYTNGGCRYCHEDTPDRVTATNTVNFHVPAVDYATACKKCHWVQPSSHPYHKSNHRCASCHFGFENGNRAMFPSVVSSSGAYFASAGSITTTDYALLHTIHGTSRWPVNARATNSKCGSCHARAACRVCHAGVIPQTHGDHTWNQISQSYLPSYTPPATLVCTGTQVGVENQVSSAVITETCYLADCHNVSTSTPDPEQVEETDGSVAYQPGIGTDTRYNWVQRSDYRMTNRLDASATLTFNGMKASVIGWKGNLCSALDVWVDGAYKGTFDNYQSGTSVKGKILYTTDTLSKGPHTLTLVVAQGASGASSHYTMIEYFTVYPAVATLKGYCVEPCHSAKLYNHDPNSFDHVSSMGGSLEATVNGGSKNFRCDDCHNMQVSTIGGEHGRASTLTSPGGSPMDCTTCHTTYADNTSIPLSLNAWNSTTPSRTCFFGSCHAPWSPRSAHAQMSSDHATPTASNAQVCMGKCHASRLTSMHVNAVKIGDPTRTSCKVCHTASQMPVAGNNCIDCHYVMEGHYYTGSEPTHTITAAEASSTYLGVTCNKCHLTQLNPEHQKASSLATTGATPGCTYCHSRSWFPSPWNKTCGTCHSGAGKAPSSHAATTTKHNYSSSSAFCGGSDCHSVTDASVTHQTPRSDCISSCHTTATVVTTATTCYSGTCHNGDTAYHPTTAAAHVGTQTACMTGCHDRYVDTSVGHGGSGMCPKCHQNSTLTSATGFVGGSYSNLCTGCHKSGAGGISTHNYLPVDPNHNTGNDTSHTASGDAATGKIYSGAGDASGTACTSLCHVTTLASEHATVVAQGSGASQNGQVTCVECHSDNSYNSSVTVHANWTERKCSNCHDYSGHVTHDTTSTLHDMSADASNTACANTGCHSALISPGLANDVAALHSTAATSTFQRCNVCHRNDGKVLGILSGSTVTKCVNCHVDHSASSVPSHDSTSSSDGCSMQGTGCHGNSYANYGASSNHRWGDMSSLGGGCGGKCHDSSYSNINPATWTSGFNCTTCHRTGAGWVGGHDYTPADPNHSTGNDTSHTANITAGLYSGVATDGVACNLCHTATMKSVHTTTTVGLVNCSGCHNNTSLGSTGVVKSSWPTRLCTACHTSSHNTYASTHATAIAGCTGTGAGCHNSTDVKVLHSNAATGSLTGCRVCHKTTDMLVGTLNCSASGCHTPYVASYTPTETNHSTGNDTSHTANITAGLYSGVATDGVACNLCHTATMKSVHTTTSVGVVSCTGCHNNTSLNSTAVVKTNWPNRLCTACHTSSHNSYASVHATTIAGCTDAGVGCHNTSDVKVLHSTATTQGGTLTGCRVCHKATDALVGTLNCSTAGCHPRTVFTPVDPQHYYGTETSHTSLAASMGAYVTTSGATYKKTCAACHFASRDNSLTVDLRSEHATLQTGYTSPNMTCAECHNDTSLNSTTVVKTNWPSRTCGACHGSTSSTHTAAATVATATGSRHDFSADASNTACVSGCHAGFTVGNIARAHSLGTTMTGARTSCNVCHDDADTNLHTVTKCGDGRCHLDRTVPHGMPSHDSTASSDGCSQQGTGCHGYGYVNAGTNSNHRWGDMSSLGGGCGGKCHDSSYANIDPATWTSGFNCTTCHRTGAGWVGGHDYTPADPNHSTGNDTSHTANITAGLYSGVATDGVACNVCHTATMKSVHTTTTVGVVGCNSGGSTSAGCHGTNASLNSTAVVKTNWPNRLCTACHTSSHNSYTSAHATSVAGCTDAGTGCHNTTDVRVLHSTATTQGGAFTGCRVCHRTTDMLVGTLDCSTVGCHTPYRATYTPVDANHSTGNDTSHTADIASGSYPSINTSGVACNLCHTATMKSVHTTTTVGAVACATCHNNTSLGSTVVVKTNWPTRLCTACHTSTHNTVDASHTAVVTGCTDAGAGCHNTSNVRTLHSAATTQAGTLTGCRVCHETADMLVGTLTCTTAGCHPRTVFSPIDPEHYYGTETSHTSRAASMAAYVTTAGAVYKKNCAECHFSSRGVTTTVDLRSEHATIVGPPTHYGGSITCTECHNDTYLGAVNVVNNDWPGRSCGDCHGSITPTHTNAAVLATQTGSRHNFSSIASNTACASGGCHTGFTVGNIARAHSLGTTMTGARTSCNVCHDDAHTNMQTITRCDDGRCHLDRRPAHGPSHTGSMPLGAQVGSLNASYTLGRNVGCFGCHFENLVREHGPAAYIPSINATGAGRSMNGGNGGTDGCGVCHNNKGTPGSYSSNASITAAIANKDHRCVTCHNNASSGTSRPHVPTSTTNGSYLTTGPLWVNPEDEMINGPQRGGHNTLGLFFPKTANLNATTTVWNIPTLSTWLDPAFSTTTATPVLCSECHNFGSNANGPQGANVKINIAQGWSQSEFSSPTVVNWGATGNGQVVCFKCHTESLLGSVNPAHANHNGRGLGSGGACIDCHVRIPHGFKRPRMLRRTAGGPADGTPVKGAPAWGVPADTLPYAERDRESFVGWNWKADMSTWAQATDCAGGNNCKNGIPTTKTGGTQHQGSVPPGGFWP